MATRRRRPRGYIEQLPSRAYRAVVYAGTDPLTGMRRNLRETAARYDAAKVALTKLQRQVDEDRHPKTAITVRQAITQWLEVAELEDTARERYDDLIRLYVLPTFGDMQASKLDAELLERFYARLQKPRAVLGSSAGRARLSTVEQQHRSQGALHHSRRPGARRALAPPRHEQSRPRRSAVARSHRAGPTERP